MSELSAEDAKLFTLARAARARVGADEGAAVRDGDGRSYTGVAVVQPSFRLSALQLAVASALAAGASTLEAAVVVTGSQDVDTTAVTDMAPSAPVRVMQA
jgi:cytidine deaminase